MLFGYTCVSPTVQYLALQKEALEKAPCERIYEDMISRTKAEHPGPNLIPVSIRSLSQLKQPHTPAPYQPILQD